MKLLTHGGQFPLQFISPDLALVSPKLTLEITISISPVQPWETVSNNRYHGDEAQLLMTSHPHSVLMNVSRRVCNFDWAPHILQDNGVGDFLEDLTTWWRWICLFTWWFNPQIFSDINTITAMTSLTLLLDHLSNDFLKSIWNAVCKPFFHP